MAAAATEDPTGAAEGGTAAVSSVIDEIYEFSAPRFFDFTKAESKEDMRKAELWFDTALSHAPSPFMPRIRTGRSLKVDSLCDFTEADQIPKVGHYMIITSMKVESAEVKDQTRTEACSTPQPSLHSQKGGALTDSKKHQSARHIASLVKNPSVLKSKSQAQSSQVKGVKPQSSLKNNNTNNPAGAFSFAHENQAIKRQKLEDGKSRQILNVRPPQPLPHKSKLGLSTSNANGVANRTQKEERKVYVRETAVQAPFVSTAEMMRKFQTSTRELSLPIPQGKPKLTLTRPKEPAFETAQRVRPVRVKSSAELEEEMLAKIPKFKARPVNKKVTIILASASCPLNLVFPSFYQEFHLETAVRATHNAESASVASTEVSRRNNEWKPHCTEPKTPLLQTSLRARPVKVKSTLELEKEALEKIPKFKAKPLNKKIFESKGELGIFCNTKKQVTVPKEFHFAIDERIPPPTVFADMFDKLSLNSESQDNHLLPRNTAPNPFHLHTEERGAEKERRLAMELERKKMEDELARVPKATPYPYTTDYPVVPPKPNPKPSTRPEPFQLESLVRHEEEMQKEMEDRLRKEKEEAQMRIFKAQPVLKEDPIPVPEKVRIPLTEVQQIHLHVDHRAVDRKEFDQKVKQKEMMYKRYREESEAAKMIEEEKALKQLRRTMVPHARPVPNFEHPFCPQKSCKVATKPKSPKLRVLHRREQQKRRSSFMRAAAAASSPASCMR
ncbi:unnamed protein product [Linum tenue]|uniref:Protein TPX2 n=1 Tax=Linum tenue TaxID=586396 RepID=A0AAV0QXA9_9ROSI|nr:unnamed protein product [Linum tenue]